MIISLWRLGGDRHLSVYTVHEEPNPVADRLDRAERLAFLRDGFSWPAALWTPLWMASRQLWVPLAIYAAVVAAVGSGLHLMGAGTTEIAVAVLAVHLIVGYESYQLERWVYEARGFTLAGTVAGKNKIECERRFFETWLPRQPVISSPVKPSSGQPANGTLAASAGNMTGASAEKGRAASTTDAGRWRLFRPRTA